MVDVQGSTEASRSAGQGGGRTSRCWRWSSWSSRRMSSAVFSVAAAIASRRGGFGLGCAGGLGSCAGEGWLGVGCPSLGCRGGALVSSSLRRRMTHRSARSTSKLASATGPERFAPVLVRRGRRAVWSGRQVRSDQVHTSSAVGSRENFFGEITKTLKLNETCL